MTKNKIEEIHYKRFYKVVEEKNKVWSVKTLLERINRMMPSNIELSENGLRALISHQYIYHTFKCPHTHNGKTTTYYIFRKCLPIEN